jgi:hypothetical protein
MSKYHSKKGVPTKKPESTNDNSAKRVARKTIAANKMSIFNSLETHLKNHQKAYIIAITFIAFVFSFLSFDNKISTANDDALYIEAGANYAKNFFGYYYTETAPFYPIILSFLIKILGVKLFLLKASSILFFCVALYFIYKAFKDRIPYIILFPALLLTAINAQFLVYASLTYTETFSLMMFALALLFFFKVFDKLDQAEYSLQSNFIHFILLGFLCFILMITRNVALAALGILVVFLIYRKKYIESIISAGSFVVIYFIYNLALKHIWHLSASQFTSQGSKMFNKDAYQPQLGKETTSGLVIRFWENCQIYISSRLYFILGFREEMSPNNIALTLFTIGIVVWSAYLMFSKKLYALLFSTLFFAGLLAATFISLHTSWGQSRLIMIYLPFILFNVFYLLYYYGEKLEILQNVYLVVFFILLISSAKATFKQINQKLPVFIENITGDPTYGYTPDWQNYIKMTKWCAQQFPNDTKSIAVRKAPMSFIFSEGKEFYPIYNTPTENADSLLIPLRTSQVNYIMLPELRLNPDMYIEGQFIGTMHRYAIYIQQKYPRAFEFVHQEGDLEKAQLYKINYTYIDSLKAALNPQ